MAPVGHCGHCHSDEPLAPHCIRICEAEVHDHARKGSCAAEVHAGGLEHIISEDLGEAMTIPVAGR